MYAPIVLFTYNRSYHVRQVIEALLKNKLVDSTDIFIYSDAPKNETAIDGVNDSDFPSVP